MTETRIHERKEVPVADRWNLESLFASEADWEKAFIEYGKGREGIDRLRPFFGRSPEDFLAVLALRSRHGLLGERLAICGNLRQSEDEGDS
ncbi:MAG TPA: hypothetical protein VMV44_03165, partial [Rectinemataceae bacterium]|nr:hypothetical protein [Rectinemataceae bacterium]